VKGNVMSLPFPRPGPILAAIPDNVPRPGGGGDWARGLVGGHLFLRGQNPRHGWVSVHDPDNEFDEPLTGISGIVLDPHPSGSDLPFLHPFGNDFEFHVAPDRPYFNLVAPNMQDAYLTSTNRARNEFGLNVPGVIGMEMDGGLVPDQYKPVEGDRVCLWGRLIVDAAHDDFHTEIHPPLLMVSARPTRSAQQHPNSPTFDATTVQITTRPFLVSQEFDHGGLFNHLLVQLGETAANPLPTGHIDAHPRLMPMPFAGLQSVFFDIQPPSPRRRLRDRLIVESTITRRSRSVALTVIQHPDRVDAVRVNILLNEAGYVPPPDPARHDFTVSRDDLTEGDPTAAAALDATIFALAIAGLPQVAIVIAKGFPTHRYDHPRAQSAGHQNSTTRQPVTELPGIPTNLDDSQPFPLFGTLKLEWRRELAPPNDPPLERR
jgi:hypothetical protein